MNQICNVKAGENNTFHDIDTSHPRICLARMKLLLPSMLGLQKHMVSKHCRNVARTYDSFQSTTL